MRCWHSAQCSRWCCASSGNASPSRAKPISFSSLRCASCKQLIVWLSSSCCHSGTPTLYYFDGLTIGCGSFFCRKVGGGKREGKNGERNESMKAKKNKRQPSRADATGKRRTARPPGDDRVEERAPQSDGG